MRIPPVPSGGGDGLTDATSKESGWSAVWLYAKQHAKSIGIARLIAETP
jgi:hypothetical protein